MIRIHDEIAEQQAIAEEVAQAVLLAGLEQQAALLAAEVPHLLADGGPRFVLHTARLTLPGGEAITFRGSLEVAE